MEIFVFKIAPRCVIPAELCSAGSDTPQDFVRRSIRPRRMLFCSASDPAEQAVCYKIYTSLSLFCGVLHPVRLGSAGCDTPQACSAGSDTSQDFVLRGIRPHWQIKTPQNQLKKFWKLPILFKGALFKNRLHVQPTLPKAYSIHA
jgi:hypothetical protein